MNKETTKMIPGDELHLTMLMAPYNLNQVTGQGRQDLLAFGRAAFEAGKAGQPAQCLHHTTDPKTAASMLRQCIDKATFPTHMDKHSALQWIHDLEAEADAERRHHGIRNASAVRTLHALGYTWRGADAWHPAEPREGAHPDDAAVDALAALMKAKLAKQRAKGYGGWNDKTLCPQQRLSDMLRAHVDKGDPVDVANFCAMLTARGEGIAPAPQAVQAAVPDGWVPCAITYEGQHPEEIAYGPQAMMDRLKKWLDRYFEIRTAPTHPAEGMPAQAVQPQQAMEALKAAIKADPEYAWSWHCAIWSGAHDEGLETGAANRAAARVMHMAFDCDTTKNANFDAEHLSAPAHPAEGVPTQAEALRAELAEATEAADNWRRLALQFDNHRMQALGHLRELVRIDDGYAEAQSAEQFLAAPPLDGEAVLAQRIAALAATTQPAAQADEIERLRALAVTNILLRVVPGSDGMGHEVYAQSVKDVEDALTDMAQRLEDWELGIKQLAATQPAAQGIDGREFPPLTPELASILGLMCFQCISFAQALRAAGHTIKTRAEDEQAAVLHWMLGHYFQHGDDWRTAAAEDMKRMEVAARAAQAKQGGDSNDAS